MSKVVIEGGKVLRGEISVSGSKNASLPLMAATLLTEKPVNFSNVPQIRDTDAMKQLLKSYGVEISDPRHGNASEVQVLARNLRFYPSDSQIGGQFRASILVLGPLLARCGRAKVFTPGGDDIDSRGRGVDFHLTGLKKMKAIIQERDGYVEAKIPENGLTGTNIVLPKVSVGATQNIMMAACAAEGETVIENASIEPETVDLAKFLRSIGAKIDVDKANRRIKIEGKRSRSLSLASHICHTVIPDRIEAATYAIAAAITGGKIKLKMNVPDQEILELLESEFWRLLAAGVDITRTWQGIVVEGRREIKPVCVKTRPYPGFPTDMHPQWAALMCFSNGSCWIEETIFDGRFRYVEQLKKMGAMISYNHRKTVSVTGAALPRDSISVTATDIRGGAALILAALAKQGRTEIKDIFHVERGYEKFVEKFTSCGAFMWLGE